MKEINIIMGARIKKQRNTLNLTREKLADKIDVSPRFLADLESGKTGVSLETLKALCLTLCVSADYLLGITDDLEKASISAFVAKLNNVDEKFYPLLTDILNSISKIK